MFILSMCTALAVGLVVGPLVFIDGFRRCRRVEAEGRQSLAGFFEGWLGTLLIIFGIWGVWLSGYWFG